MSGVSTTPKRPTVADVARRCGVSTATVSYVLNDTPGHSIPASTRERVRSAAASLGYVPSAFAQALARGRSRVAVIDVSELPYGDLVGRSAREIAAALEARGYLPVVDQLDRSTGGSHERLLQLSALVAPALVVTASPLPAPVRTRLESVGVRRFGSLFADAAEMTERLTAATRAQVDHLVAVGHRRIGYCGTDEPHLAEPQAKRRDAAVDACARHGVELVVVSERRDPEAITGELERLGVTASLPTAVAAYNDEVAFAVLAAAHRTGLRVPDDLAVVGVDDSPLAAAAIPALTSVRFASSPGLSVEDLVERVLADDPDASPYAPVEVEVVRRRSA